MIRGSTFNLQKLLSTDHALEVETYYNKREGVIRGCNVTTNADGTLNISAGYLLIKGRLIEFMGDTSVPVPSTEATTLYSSLVIEIDLSKTNTQTELNQVSVKIISGTDAYPTLIKEDINFTGLLYQFELAKFINSLNGVTQLTRTADDVSMAGYATVGYGTNANGQYIRFDNGTQICWNSYLGTQMATSNTYGNALVSGTVDWIFPAAFISNPSLQVGARRVSGGGAYGMHTGALSAISATALRIAGTHDNTIGVLQPVAIGRWK